MEAPIEHSVAAVLPALLRELRAHPAGLSEFELIKRLERVGEPGFEAAALRTPLSLFRTHFLLFHSLYLLRAELEAQGETLAISCLKIKLERRAFGSRLPAEPDPMAAYYLDLSQLERTDAAQVERLLGGFWAHFHRNDRRGEALAALGLDASAGPAEIKQRYRRLAMQHHPDRGGDTAELQRLNAAMAVLEDP